MQKRAPNRGPPPITANDSNLQPPPLTPEQERQGQERWRKNLSTGWNSVTRIDMFQPTDSLESCKRVFELSSRLGEICSSGDLESLKAVITEIQTGKDPILNRPSSWEFWDNYPAHFENAYKNNHWHIIEYLAGQPEFHILPPKLCSGNWEGLPSAVADRALETNCTDELQKLLDLGWDINLCTGSSAPPSLW
jgi:hypothetical protein